MKYSEAILLGATLRKQTFQWTFDGTGTCANGAALEAVGELDVLHGARRNFNGKRLRELFPIYDVVVWCPINADHDYCGRFTVGDMVTHLNDMHRWSRERIAAFVATIEREHEPKEAVPVQGGYPTTSAVPANALQGCNG